MKSLFVCLMFLSLWSLTCLAENQSLNKELEDVLWELETNQKTYIDLLEKGQNSDAVQKTLAKLNLRKIQIEKSLRTEAKVTSESKIKTEGQFKYRGHFQYRLEGARNTKGVSGSHQQEQSFYRLRTYLSYQSSPQMNFNLTPQATKGFGANDSSNNPTSGSTVQTQVNFFEANLEYAMTNAWSMKLGKQEFSYGDQLVIGPAPWDNSGRSFDALKFNLKTTNGKTDFVFSKIDDNSSPQDSQDDTNFSFIYSSWSFGEKLRELDFYLMNQQDKKPNGVEVNLLGIRGKGELGRAFYRHESGVEKGEKLEKDAFQTNTEVGLNLGVHKVSFEYGLAGYGYRQLYPTAHRFLGFADLLGRRNIEQYAIHFTGVVNSWLSVSVDQHFFRRHNSRQSAYKLNGKDAIGSEGNAKDIGRETDIILNLRTIDRLHLQLGAALFTSDKYLEQQSINRGKATRFLYAQLICEF